MLRHLLPVSLTTDNVLALTLLVDKGWTKFRQSRWFLHPVCSSSSSSSSSR